MKLNIKRKHPPKMVDVSFYGRGRRTRTLGTWFWSKLRFKRVRAKVSRVLSQSLDFAVGGNTTVDAILMLIDVIPPHL